MSGLQGGASAAVAIPASNRVKDGLRAKHAHAGVAMAAATLAMGATSGIQALLYLSSFGVGARTDGFFAAFALYASFGVFSQSIRITSAPLLVGRRPDLSPRDFGLALVLIAVPVGLATIPLAGPLASVIAPGVGHDGRGVTEAALPILGTAMVLQLWAAGGATLLAVRDRFDRVAFAYMAGAGASLAAYLAVVDVAGELALAWSMLAMAVVTCAAMLDGVRAGAPASTEAQAPARISVRRLLSSAWLLLSRTAVYLAFNGLYVVTLAFAGGYDAGDATVLSYVYLFASYLVAATGFALGMSRIADMRRGALADWREVIADTVPAGFRYSMLLVAPALAALIVGASLLGELFPSSFDGAQVAQLRAFAGLLCAWTVAALLVNLLLPALFALGRARLVNALALPIVALHVGVTALGGALWGAPGVVGAFFAVPLCFGVVLLVAGCGSASGRIARELAADGLRFAALAAVSFGPAALLGAALGGGVPGTLLSLVVGACTYGLLSSRLAGRQLRLLAGAVRPASA
jgi:hypothetical protein